MRALRLLHAHVGLRRSWAGDWGVNVLALSDEQVERIQRLLATAGMGVAAIGSPIGKTPIDAPFEEELRRLERAIALAHRFAAPCIRIFSFYPPTGGGVPATSRDEVLARLGEMTARARTAGVILVHENEKDIYGDTIARCVDLHESIGDPYLRAALDPANFIQCGEIPYPDGYEALCPWLGYVHVKDALADGTVTPAGAGLARWPELLAALRADGYEGVLSLEPHLAEAGRFAGFSGPDRFREASQALQGLLRAMDWPFA